MDVARNDARSDSAVLVPALDRDLKETTILQFGGFPILGDKDAHRRHVEPPALCRELAQVFRRRRRLRWQHALPRAAVLDVVLGRLPLGDPGIAGRCTPAAKG